MPEVCESKKYSTNTKCFMWSIGMSNQTSVVDMKVNSNTCAQINAITRFNVPTGQNVSYIFEGEKNSFVARTVSNTVQKNLKEISFRLYTCSYDYDFQPS